MCDSIISPHLCTATKGQRSRVYGTRMWKIIFVECHPIGGQWGVHRDPNAIAAQHPAQFSSTCQKMRGDKHVKV